MLILVLELIGLVIVSGLHLNDIQHLNVETPANNSVITQLFNEICFNSTLLDQYICPPSIVQTGYDQAHCSDGASYQQSCVGGFFSSIPDNTPVPCCPGFFCSRTTICLQECSAGALCIPGNSTNATQVCQPVNLPPVVVYVNGTWQSVCPGATTDSPCVPGMYCPNTTSILECPAGFYCPLGTVEPESCSHDPFDKCAPGQQHRPGMKYAAVVTGCVLVFHLIMMLVRLLIYPSIHSKSWDDRGPMDRGGARIQAITLQDVRVWHDGKLVFSVPSIHSDRNGPSILGLTLLPGLTALVGVSGGGKSTLIKVLASAQDGLSVFKCQFKLEGVTNPLNFDQFLKKHGSRIGYVPQEDIMHGPLTVFEVVFYTALLRTNASISQCRNRALYYLAKLHLRGDKILNRDVSVLSGGQKKRVNVAMELVTNPLLLLLDEPTSGLDSETAAVLMTCLQEEFSPQSGRVALVVIHQPSHEVAMTFHFMLGLEARKTRESDPVHELCQKFGSIYLHPIWSFDAVPSTRSVVQVEDEMGYSNHRIPRNAPRNFVDGFINKVSEGSNTPEFAEVYPALEGRLKMPSDDCTCIACVRRFDFRIPVFGFIYHVLVSFWRSIVIAMHDYTMGFFISSMAFIAFGMLIGWFNRNVTSIMIPSAILLLLLATVLVAVQSSIRVRLNNQAARRREIDRGVAFSATYIGEILAELIFVASYPYLLLIWYIPLAHPEASFLVNYVTLLCVSVTATALAHMASLFEKGAHVISISLVLFSTVFMGFSPDKAALGNWTYLSFMSFPFESLLKGEFYQYTPVLQILGQMALVQLGFCQETIPAMPDALPVPVDCPLDYDLYKVIRGSIICVIYGMAFYFITLISMYIRLYDLGDWCLRETKLKCLWRVCRQACCCSFHCKGCCCCNDEMSRRSSSVNDLGNDDEHMPLL